MSEKQPEALRLAQLIQDGCPMDEAELVDELRRLHTENAELRKALEKMEVFRVLIEALVNTRSKHFIDNYVDGMYGWDERAEEALSKSKEQA